MTLFTCKYVSFVSLFLALTYLVIYFISVKLSLKYLFVCSKWIDLNRLVFPLMINLQRKKIQSPFLSQICGLSDMINLLPSYILWTSSKNELASKPGALLTCSDYPISLTGFYKLNEFITRGQTSGESRCLRAIVRPHWNATTANLCTVESEGENWNVPGSRVGPTEWWSSHRRWCCPRGERSNSDQVTANTIRVKEIYLWHGC